jgi:hypothetical protein
MTNVEAAIKKLEPGIMYRIVYKQQLGNYQWYEHEMFAQYIGKGDNDKLLFSLRSPARRTSTRRTSSASTRCRAPRSRSCPAGSRGSITPSDLRILPPMRRGRVRSS